MSSGGCSYRRRKSKSRSGKVITDSSGGEGSENTSCVLMNSGGYDFDFVEQPPDELTCSICQLVLRDPQLTSCCGHHFCQSCVAQILAEWSPCPLCKEGSFTTFLDKSFQRKVSELEILCPRSESGCTWTGTVGTVANHLDGDCQYVEDKCELCNEDIQRKNIEEHKNDACPNRPFTCEYCSYSKTWIEVTSKHFKKCANFPLQCPNQCGIGVIQRKNLNTHIKALCPLQVGPCVFEFAGCTVQTPRKDNEEHLATNTAAHVTLLAGVCAEYKRKLDTKQEEVNELQATVKTLKDVIKSHDSMILSLNQKLSQLQVSQLSPVGLSKPPPLFAPPPLAHLYPPVDFYLQNLSFFKQNNKKWVSRPFYTHPGGYKMCLSVFPNGLGKGKANQNHIAVFANLMRGELDDRLEWPFQGDVYVRLHLESVEDVVKTLTFGPKAHVKAVQRVTEGEVSEFGQGDFHFAHHSKLGSLNNLHFTVQRVNWKSNR